MWATGWSWPLIAGSAVFVACSAATLALLPPLQRRARAPHVAKTIPLSTYLSFDFSVRIRAFLLSKGGVSSKLTKIPDVEAVADGIIRVLGKNPSRMTLQGTNTYLLGHGPKRILIDASDGNLQYVRNLLDVCKSHGVEEITDLVITHGHSDHIGGVVHLREAFPSINVWKYMPTGGADRSLRYSNAECEALLMKPLKQGMSFAIPQMDAVLRTEYMPGHCADHVCFLLEQKASQSIALFSGDCILGEGSCVFESLTDLMNSLLRLRALSPSVIYPAHGPVIKNAAAKIEEYITHRLQREKEILTVLASTAKPVSTKEIVGAIYSSLPFMLRLAAQKAVEKHLVKLLHERRVTKTEVSGWMGASTTYMIRSERSPGTI